MWRRFSSNLSLIGVGIALMAIAFSFKVSTFSSQELFCW